MSEFEKGSNQGWAKPGNYEQQQGVWAAQKERQREQEAAARAAREREVRQGYLTASGQQPTTSGGVNIYSSSEPHTPAPFKQIVSRTAMVALVCTTLVWFLLLDRPVGPDLIGVLAGGYFGGAVLGAALWALGWTFHFVGIVLRVVVKYTMVGGLLLALFFVFTGRLPF